MAKILVIDDEVALLRALGTGLRARGYELVTAETGEDGLIQAAQQEPDVVLLDLGLPDLDGVEVCKRLRKWTAVPVVVLSAHGTEARKVEALDSGADDFITKPFGMAELEARLRVALRHRRALAGSPEEPVLEVGPLVIDMAGRTVRVAGHAVDLTPREFDLLAFLARNRGRVITHRVLLEEVWGEAYGTETQYLRVYVNHLRKKVEADPAHPRLLRTSPGVGYQLVSPDLTQ
jgi:two-component system, OmpR family, KDP operon response regulator KdpE